MLLFNDVAFWRASNFAKPTWFTKTKEVTSVLWEQFQLPVWRIHFLFPYRYKTKLKLPSLHLSCRQFSTLIHYVYWHDNLFIYVRIMLIVLILNIHLLATWLRQKAYTIFAFHWRIQTMCYILQIIYYWFLSPYTCWIGANNPKIKIQVTENT